MMTFQKIASGVAKREGKKSQARIGDIREILKILVDWSVAFSLDRNNDEMDSPICSLDHMVHERLAELRGKADQKKTRKK